MTTVGGEVSEYVSDFLAEIDTKVYIFVVFILLAYILGRIHGEENTTNYYEGLEADETVVDVPEYDRGYSQAKQDSYDDRTHAYNKGYKDGHNEAKEGQELRKQSKEEDSQYENLKGAIL